MVCYSSFLVHSPLFQMYSRQLSNSEQARINPHSTENKVAHTLAYLDAKQTEIELKQL